MVTVMRRLPLPSYLAECSLGESLAAGVDALGAACQRVSGIVTGETRALHLVL
jgi:hypothetical protein